LRRGARYCMAPQDSRFVFLLCEEHP